MMSQIEINQCGVRLKGNITFATVQRLNEALSQQYAVIEDVLTVDFEEVDKVDSSALALCLSLLRNCQGAGAVSFQNVPHNLQEIAASVGVAELFRAN